MGPLALYLSVGLILSVLSPSVVAYRNDLSSTRHGCIWSTIDEPISRISTPISTALLNPQSNQQALASSGASLNCNLRTLSADFWNYTFNREQIDRTLIIRIKCSDKLFFESLLSPNQTLFQLTNLKEVQIESCKIRKVPRRVWATLTKLKSLIIRTQNTEWRSSSVLGLELESGAFDSLDQLEVLDLSENNIWTFPQKTLCPLRNLVKLNISRNRLTDIDEITSHQELQDCSLNIQNLDLSHNTLRRIGKDAFSSIKRLSELRLHHNLIAELEDSSFSGLNQLKLLNLSSNRLVALPPSIFRSNSNLRELYLQNNSISALSSQVFSKMDQLLLLDLSGNMLSSQWVKEDIFKSLLRLVVLKLSRNQLSYIDSSLFKDLISLQALHLGNNRIETINPDAFQSLSNLHILDLSNNRLSYVDAKIFSNLFVLRQLYMDHNKLRKMDDDSLKNCTSLQDLGLADNSLIEVPVALQSLVLLKTLDIGENKIVHVSNSSFSGMGQLYGLRMVDNRLQELAPGFCGSLKKLRVLNLSQNRINTISPGAFLPCPELRVLRLDTNLLEELPPTLKPQLGSLLWLNVSENRLRWADYHLLPKSIEWLDLSHNNIESLKGPYKNQTNSNTNSNTIPYHLRVLDLSYNKLDHLDQSAIPSSLETLRVNHNHLKIIEPDTFLRSTRLRRVELVSNQISNLPLPSLRFPTIPSGLKLPEFYLGDNPFLCDCSMEWLTRVNQLGVARQYPRILDLDAIVCTTTFSRSTSISTTMGSPGHAVIPLVEARPRDFLCPYKSHCFTLCHCCDFDACDCEMQCPDNCTCYHDTAWSSNIVECSNLQYENIPSRIPMDATEIYLDGNRIYQLGSHIFIGKKNLRTLYLNDSHVESIKNKTFNGLKSLEVLRLEENLLTELNGYEFSDLESLRELYLHNNLIRFIAQDTFSQLKFLQVLRLDGNAIVDFNVWQLSRNGYLNSVMLASNPWSCDCDFLSPFRNWVASKTAIVVDFNLAKCQITTDNLHSDSDSTQLEQVQPTISSMCNYNSDITFNYDSGNNEIEINNHISPMEGEINDKAVQPLPLPPSDLNFSRLDSDTDNTFWALILCLTAFVIVILVVVLIFRQEIYYWGTNFLLPTQDEEGTCLRNLCCCCPGKYSGGHQAKDDMDDQDKLFDAYFLYSKKDEDLLLQKIAPELEDFPTTNTTSGLGHKLRLCLHYRDLCLSPESPWNREMILSACDASKRVVILLSKTFLQNEFHSSSHFRQSIQSAIALHQRKIIFLMLPDFNNQISELTRDKNVIKNSSVEWTDKNFWMRFRRLLPTPVYSTIISPQSDLNINISNTNTMMLPNCESQLPYNLVMNPNLLQHLQLQQLRTNAHHYHQNIIPYQIPVQMNRNNSLPPIPKHQIVLPVNNTNTIGLFNPHQNVHHNPITNSNLTDPTNPNFQNHSVIHPIPSQLTPQHFGYSNETFREVRSNHPHHHPGHNNHNQPIHFSSQHPHPHHHQHQHSHPVSTQHSHTESQLSTNFSSVFHPHPNHIHNHNQNPDTNYSSSAVSSCANDDLDHVYSTLDSPLSSPSPKDNLKSESGNLANKHMAQHSTSSGVSSGSDMTNGDSSSAVSPSSPVKNGILNKFQNPSSNLNSGGPGSNNGKMYFV